MATGFASALPTGNFTALKAVAFAIRALLRRQPFAISRIESRKGHQRREPAEMSLADLCSAIAMLGLSRAKAEIADIRSLEMARMPSAPRIRITDVLQNVRMASAATAR